MRAASPSTLSAICLAGILCCIPAVGATVDPYTQWTATNWGLVVSASTASEASIWGYRADPDHDGICNLVEYACKTDPKSFTPASACYVFAVPGGADPALRHPSLTTWIRTDDPALGVICQTSTDLANWSPDPLLGFSGSMPPSTLTTQDEGDNLTPGLRQVKYQDLQSLADRSTAFMRLRVTRDDISVTSPAIEPFVFTPGQIALTGTTVRSNAITLGGFAGTVSASVPAGARLYVNGVLQSLSSVSVKAGDVLWLEAVAPAETGMPQSFTLTVGGQSADWSFTSGTIPIVPDHSGISSGYSPVESGVSESGAAQVSVPIVVSPGTAGMQPKLSINYTSQGGNGPLGLGFSLSGMSAISRVGASTAQDGFKGSVAFGTNDRFALDGQRLIAINGLDGADGTEYRLEFDPSSRIRSYQQQGSGPARWVVETKAGLILEFGTTSGSRVSPESCPSALVWAVEKISDTLGNSMTFGYDVLGRQRGELLVTSIAYTQNTTQALTANQSIVFEYEDRPDPKSGYMAGYAMRFLKRLRSVESRATKGGVSTMVRRYSLVYEQAAISNLSKLLSIQETLSDGSQLPPVSFQWKATAGSRFTILDEHGQLENEDIGQSPPVPLITGDFNKDGKHDLLMLDEHGSHWKALATGAGLFGLTKPIPELVAHPISGWTGNSRVRIADFNGDGRSDILHIRGDQNPGNFLALAENDNTFRVLTGAQISGITNLDYATTDWADLITMDLNADGRADILRLQGNGDQIVALSNGDGTFQRIENPAGLENKPVSSIPNRSWIIPGDFNGDGRGDVLHLHYTDRQFHWLALSKGDGSFEMKDHASMGVSNLQYSTSACMVGGDYNGDGLTDIFYQSTSPDDSWLLTSKGDGSFTYQQTPGGFAGVDIGDNSDHLVSEDFNGDGLSDVLHFAAAPHKNFIAYSRGDGTFQVDKGAAAGTWAERERDGGSRFVTGDFNGDGKGDFLYFSSNDGCWSVQAEGFDPLVVEAVDYGHGQRTNFSYQLLTDSSVYTRGNSFAYPYYDLQMPMRVVSAVTQRNGVDGDAFTGANASQLGSNTITYRYEGAWADMTGRGFQGFQAVVSTDATSGIITRTEYENSSPLLAGRPKRTEQRLSAAQAGGSALISESTTTWQLLTTTRAGKPNTYFVAEATSASHSYEVNRPSATALRGSVTRGGPVDGKASYDAFGNLLASTTTTSAPDGSFLTEEVVNLYADSPSATQWHLGRLTTSTVTKTAPNPIPGSSGTVSASRVATFQYHPVTGLLVQEVVEPGAGELRQQKDYAHDGFGNILTSTLSIPGSAARVTSTTYTPDGRFLASTTNAKGHTESKVYDPLLGNTLSQTGPNGLTTTWQYDALGRPQKETRADGTETRSFFRRVTGATLGAPPRAVHYVRVQSTGGAPKTVWYDLLDREIRSDAIAFDGRTVLAHKVYNARGEVSHASHPAFLGETPLYSVMEYDAVGRQTLQTDPGNRVSKTTYDGLTVTLERTAGTATASYFQKTSTRVNAMGWTVASTQHLGALGKTVTRSYDPYGSIRFVRDPAGNTTELRYDHRGNKVWMSEPNSGISTYSYNGFGELTHQTNAAGQIVEMQYDVLGRLVARIEPEGGATFEYDTAAQGIGQLARESTSGFQRQHYYDVLARPVAATESHGSQVFATSKQYDPIGRPATITYPSGFAVRQSYNSLGHLEQVQHASNASLVYWRALTVNARGQVTQEAQGNGVVTSRTFDPETGLVEAITAGRTVAGDVQKLEFDFDFVGNLSARRDLRYAAPFAEQFQYDTLNRLTQVATTASTPVTAAYDDLGNLLQRSDVGHLEYGGGGSGPHAVTAVSQSTTGLNKLCSYDLKGNRTIDGATSLDYSSFNKPLRIRKGEESLRFDYGTDRALYRQTLYRKTSSGKLHQTVRDYVGGLYEREVTSEGLVRHIHYVAGGGGVTAIHTEARTTSATAPKTRYIHKDHLGSVDAITDSSGGVVERQSFDAWGRPRTLTFANNAWAVTYPTPPEPGAEETHRGFTGHEMLHAMSLVHMGGRVYDPLTARFLSPDPFVQSPDNLQNLNRYSYVLNNPLSMTDPSGFFFKSIGKFLKNNWKTIAAVGIGIVTAGMGVWGAAILAGQSVSLGTAFSAIAGAGGFGLTSFGAAVAGASFGFGTAFSGTLLAGGSVGDAMRAGLKSGAISGIAAFGAFQVGEVLGHATTAQNYLAKVVAHGVVSGGASELGGGSFTHGFLAAGFTAGLSPLTNQANLGVAAKTVLSALVGGTASVVGGGKFANGAISGACIQLFNEGQGNGNNIEKVKEIASTAKEVHEGVDNLNQLDIELSSKTGKPTLVSQKLRVLLDRADPLMRSVDLHSNGAEFFETPNLINAIEVGGVFSKHLSAGMFFGEQGVKGANWLGVQAFGQDSMDDFWLGVGDSSVGRGIGWTARQLERTW